MFTYMTFFKSVSVLPDKKLGFQPNTSTFFLFLRQIICRGYDTLSVSTHSMCFLGETLILMSLLSLLSKVLVSESLIA